MSGIWAGMTQVRLLILLTGSPSTALSTWRGLIAWQLSAKREPSEEPGWNCMTFCNWTLEHRASLENSKRFTVQPRFRRREPAPSEGGEALSHNRGAWGRREMLLQPPDKTQPAMGMVWGCNTLRSPNLFLHQIVWANTNTEPEPVVRYHVMQRRHDWGLVLAVCWRVTYYHKIHGLKHTHWLAQRSVGQKSSSAWLGYLLRVSKV